MLEKNIDRDVAKELIMILSYCDDEFITNIPDDILKKLNDLAADSLKDIYIDSNKSLEEQVVSDECKDLLSLMYLMYNDN